ncbi:MAG: preprotein translocase subunit SecY [Campylobacter concisus]|nr:preprotein translocase subunit SecY [Campylobacter concisus]
MTYQDKTNIKKVGYTIFVILACLTLSHIPVWGLSSDTLSQLFKVPILSFTDVLAGGALSKLAIGGFGVTSLIMAGIVIQLLALIAPKIEKLHGQGEMGRRFFDRLTLILAMLFTLGFSIATVWSSVAAYGFGIYIAVPMIEWLIGSFIIVKLAQSVHDFGIGNGSTLILAANIAQRIPAEIIARSYQPSENVWIVCVMLLCVILVSVYYQYARIDIEVQQTRKAVSVMNAEGRVSIPMAMSSVLPLIYASGFIAIPSLIGMFVHDESGRLGVIINAFQGANMYNPVTPEQWAGLGFFIFLVVFFSLYASRMSFSSGEVVNRMMIRGDVIKGVPVSEMAPYLEKRRKKLAWISSIFMVIIAVVPDMVALKCGVTTFSFMGTSLIILMAAFMDVKIRLTGMMQSYNKKYELFKDGE